MYLHVIRSVSPVYDEDLKDGSIIGLGVNENNIKKNIILGYAFDSSYFKVNFVI